VREHANESLIKANETQEGTDFGDIDGLDQSKTACTLFWLGFKPVAEMDIPK
jgi:hypothetical protein